MTDSSEKRQVSSNERISDLGLRNIRSWASTRHEMSGSQAIVAAIDELLKRRAADTEIAELRRELADAREFIANAIGGCDHPPEYWCPKCRHQRGNEQRRRAPETEALPSIEELLTNLPPGAEERLANAISTSIRLETLSNRALVDMALDGRFEGSPTATLVLHEMCSRLHPGWENEIPEEDVPAQKAKVVLPTCAHGATSEEVCPECMGLPSDNPDEEIS